MEGCTPKLYCNVYGLQKTPCDAVYSSASLVWSPCRGLQDERNLSCSWGGSYSLLPAIVFGDAEAAANMSFSEFALHALVRVPYNKMLPI